MRVKKQHFVPRVYLKGWEGSVRSLQEPNKSFQGVYIYDKKNISVGDGRTRETILARNHTYTIDYDYFFLAWSCQEILDDLATQIFYKLSKRNVIARFKELNLNSPSLIASMFRHLEEWDFITATSNTAPKKAIFNDIKNTNSYVIESAFGTNVESHWDNILSQFIEPAENLHFVGTFNHQYANSDVVYKMVEMYAYMACRNPTFDFSGIIPIIKKDILEPLFKDAGEAGNNIINRGVRGIWLNEICKGLFAYNQSYFSSIVSQIIRECGLVLYKVRTENEGSFITSDNPAFFHVSSVEQKNSNGLFFPLTSRYLLYIGLNSEGTLNNVLIKTVGNADIKQLNSIICGAATDSIISCKRFLGHIL